MNILDIVDDSNHQSKTDGIFIFNEGDEYRRIVRTDNHNEAVNSAEFDNIDDAMVAVSAELEWRSDMVQEKADLLGVDLSSREMVFWTSVFYLSGNGCGSKMMSNYHRKGLLENEGYLEKYMTTSYDELYRSAKKRLERFDQAKDDMIFWRIKIARI